MIVKAIEERAKERGIKEVKNRDGQTVSIEGAYNRMTLNGYYSNDEVEFDEAIKDMARVRHPAGRTHRSQTLREKGTMRSTGWGIAGFGIAQASTIEPDKTHNPFRWHTEDKVPYPTLTRRAQFYIDHDWFLEARRGAADTQGEPEPRRRPASSA